MLFSLSVSLHFTLYSLISTASGRTGTVQWTHKDRLTQFITQGNLVTLIRLAIHATQFNPLFLLLSLSLSLSLTRPEEANQTH